MSDLEVEVEIKDLIISYRLEELIRVMYAIAFCLGAIVLLGIILVMR